MTAHTSFWIGIVILAIGTTLACREHLWLRSAQIATGEVMQVIATRGAKGGTNYQPRVRFTARDGSTHDFVGGLSSSRARYSVGDSILVAYDARSYEGRVLTFGQRFGFPSVLIVAGLAVILLATIFTVGGEMVPRIYLEKGVRKWSRDSGSSEGR